VTRPLPAAVVSGQPVTRVDGRLTGRIINPKLAHSQAIGGMVGGIGMALLECTELDYSDGRVVNANMSD
jgi:hypothetical protein